MSKCCGRVPQLCSCEAAMDLRVLTVECTTRFSSALRRAGGLFKGEVRELELEDASAQLEISLKVQLKR